jgi:murein L,D-transpeptidase YcbB/YkuD
MTCVGTTASGIMLKSTARVARAAVFAVAANVACSRSSAQPAAEHITPQKPVSELSLELNIPAMRLDLRRGRDLVHSYIVAVGMRAYTTPVGTFSLYEITWNPWWYPPASPWARKEKITPPGPSNPMGKVKLHVGGALYLHATPFESSMGQAASHACVRMRTADAVSLARLVQRATGARIGDAEVDSLIARWTDTRVVDLPAVVPASFVYHLAEVRNDSLLLHPDIYRRRTGTAEAEALRVLGAAGYDTTRVNGTILKQLLQTARTQHAGARVDRIIGAAPAAARTR